MRRLALKTYVLAPIALALAVLLGAFVWVTYRHQQARLAAQTVRDLHTVQDLLSLQLEREAATMRVALVALMRDRRLQTAFETRDREALFEQMKPLFERLREEHDVTHFYFVAPDRECIVRIHKPDRFGDTLNRFTMRRAEQTGVQVWGVELGPLGTCTLRTVMPWRRDDTLLGFVEMGEEIDHVIQKIHRATGIDLVVLVRKAYLQRDGWEGGMQMLGRDADWDRFPDVVLIDKIPSTAPQGFEDALTEILDRPGESRTLFSGDARLRVDSLPLHDVADREIGRLVALRDVTAEYDAARVPVLWTSAVALLVGGALFAFFYFLLDGLQRKLQREFSDRQECEHQLREHRDHLEEVVAVRTKHLQESNEELQREIGDRVRAEEEAAQLRRLLASITDSMPSVLVAVDRQGNITEWNRKAKEAAGLSVKHVRGKQFIDVFPQLQDQTERVRKTITSGETQVALKVPSQRDGEIRYADITVYPLVGQGIAGAVIRVDDVTERVRIEEMMVQTDKMLSVGGLAAGMAHEINNPLGAILHGAQVIQQRLAPAMAKNAEAARDCGTSLEAIRNYLEKRKILAFLDHIRESGARAAKIVANMLQFSRKSDAQLTPADMAELIDRAVGLAASDYDLKKKYDFRRIQIVRDFDPELPPVPVVATEIEQVLLNLLKNGAQAMQDARVGNPRLTLRTRRVNDWAQIEVEDNGPGMSEEVRKRVFEPFFTTKDTGVGTGLGLSVSYIIVTTNHKGAMTVDSVPGTGTTFTIRLPLQRSVS